MPRNKEKAIKVKEVSILEQLLHELKQEIDVREGDVSFRITKGRALIKSMVNEALKGNQRMMTNVLKIIEKLDTEVRPIFWTGTGNKLRSGLNLYSPAL